MASRQSLHLRGLGRKLKRLLGKSDNLLDFIIFGSVAKGTIYPNDVDIAAVLKERKIGLIGELQAKVAAIIPKAHLSIVTYEDFLNSRLPYNMLFEGFSVRNGTYLSKIAGIQKENLYCFTIIDLPQTKKVMFNKGLRNVISSTNANKLGPGVILVHVSKSGEVEDFLNQWKRKICRREFLQIPNF